MRTAIIHDWLTGMRGGEKVLEAICELFPAADIFTLVWLKGKVSKKIESHRIHTSLLQQLPLMEKKYRFYLPVMPLAIEQLDLRGYDLVISSSHCVAKGVKVPEKTPHFCYCHTPMRYIWDQYDEYFSAERAGIHVRMLMKMVRPYLRSWDVKTASRVSHFIANSKHVAERIRRHYGREARVIYPPVDVDNYPAAREEGYFLMVTALVPYKRVDIAIHAFNELKLPLKIIGSGPDAERLRNMAGPSIEFLGWVGDEQIKQHYAGCRAFVFPQEEDFGITAVEAQAAGKPVIAYGQGGALETVREGSTGTFFADPTPQSLAGAVRRFESLDFRTEDITRNAARFSKIRFKEELEVFIREHVR